MEISEKTKSNIKEIFAILVCIVIIFGTGYIIFKAQLDNYYNLEKNCTAKGTNYSMIQSFNDSECGCKWYNLCDNGCFVCRLK